MHLIQSLMKRREFLIASGAVSALGLGLKRLSGAVDPGFQTGVAMAANASDPTGMKGVSGNRYARIIKTDVVVLGSGAGGMSAAIRAKQQGVEHVLILEKRAEAGGNSVFAPIPIRDDR
jgi:hypothetical protein